MVWLRYELWENHDDLSYRLANKAETDRLSEAHPGGHLRNIFYAPSPASAEAQYCALRGIGPYIVNSADSEEQFTMAQLESQLVDFPDDERLARQPALPQMDGHATVAAHGEPHAEEALLTNPHHAHDHSDDHHATGDADVAPTSHHAPEPRPHADHTSVHIEAATAPGHSADSHSNDHHAAPVIVDSHAAHAEPEPAKKSAEIEALGPITLAAPTASIPAVKSRKRNPILGFLRLIVRLVMLAIVLGAVIIGVGIATGNLKAAEVLAQARELPAPIQQHSIVRSLLP